MPFMYCKDSNKLGAGLLRKNLLEYTSMGTGLSGLDTSRMVPVITTSESSLSAVLSFPLSFCATTCNDIKRRRLEKKAMVYTRTENTVSFCREIMLCDLRGVFFLMFSQKF